MRKLGEVVLAGVSWEKSSEATAHEVLYDVFHRYVILRSGWEWESPWHTHHFDHVHTIYGNIARSMEWLVEWSSDKYMNLGELIEVIPAEKASEGYKDILFRRREKLMTVFVWREGT